MELMFFETCPAGFVSMARLIQVLREQGASAWRLSYPDAPSVGACNHSSSRLRWLK